eukprot:1138307-Pelagomonas_calceolata.AAC.3
MLRASCLPGESTNRCVHGRPQQSPVLKHWALGVKAELLIQMPPTKRFALWSIMDAPAPTGTLEALVLRTHVEFGTRQ